MSGASFIGPIGTCLMFELLSRCGWILEKFLGFREIFGGESLLFDITQII